MLELYFEHPAGLIGLIQLFYLPPALFRANNTCRSYFLSHSILHIWHEARSLLSCPLFFSKSVGRQLLLKTASFSSSMWAQCGQKPVIFFVFMFTGIVCSLSRSFTTRSKEPTQWRSWMTIQCNVVLYSYHYCTGNTNRGKVSQVQVCYLYGSVSLDKTELNAEISTYWCIKLRLV